MMKDPRYVIAVPEEQPAGASLGVAPGMRRLR